MTISFEKAIAIALEQHNAGHFDRAEKLYMEILRQDPGNVDALHLLGVLANQGKQPETAVSLITAAISRRPDAPIFHYNLADALTALGRSDDAIASLREAIRLEPDYVQALCNLGNLLNLKKDYEEAEGFCRRACELEPEAAIGWNNLGNALRGRMILEEAETAYRRAIACDPQFAEAHHNLALLLSAFRRFDDAQASFEKSLQLRPAVAQVHINFGLLHVSRGDFEKAGACFQTALDVDPASAVACNNLGSVLRHFGHLDDASRQFRRAVELSPDFTEAHCNLASSLKDVGLPEEALAAIDKLLELKPEAASAHFIRSMILRDLNRHDDGEDALQASLGLEPNNVGALTALGYALQESGDLEGAMKALRQSIALHPDPGTHSNALMVVNYHPSFSQADFFKAHQEWSTLHEAPHMPKWKPHLNDRNPDRRLRVGYVSPDFRGHVVGYFLDPVLRHHDHSSFEIFAYAHLVNADMKTWQMRAAIDHWRETASLRPDDMAARIREDQIDILVELAGHTGGNALTVFARKPAPVQINMIGFPSTTGLSAIDYRITDERCDPTGETDAYNSEKLVRLPQLFWAYEPPAECPEIGPLPADQNETLTFTSVNNFTKVTPYVQQMWAKLLVAVPKSHLIMQTSALNSERTREKVRAIFAAGGVAQDRIEFRKSTDLKTYMQLLNESDITLDPYPFNGGTTTCHSLWMGAPVLTLAGDRHASRMGLSMMSAIGLPEFIAHTPEEYVQIGVRFANDLPRLREIRRTMRDRLKASPLLDGAGYTKHLEAAYRQVWKKWCASASM